MSVIGVASTRLSPGATSLAVGLSWTLPPPVTLIEADPAGGVIGPRFSLDYGKDLLSYSVDIRRSLEPGRLFDNATSLGQAHCLLAPPHPPSAYRAVEHTAAVLGRILRRYAMHSVVDLGCLTADSPAVPLAMQVDRLLLVVRPNFESVYSMLHLADVVRPWGVPTALVLVGNGSFPAYEVADAAGLPVAAVLPYDPVTARAFAGGRFSARRLRRSVLLRAISAIAIDELSAVLGQADAQKPTEPLSTQTDDVIIPVAEDDPSAWPPPTVPAGKEALQ